MRNDKEFKAKNREDSYIKDKAPDLKLGRHGDIAEKPTASNTKKNRMYQARQEKPEQVQYMPEENRADGQSVRADETAYTELEQAEQQETISEFAEFEESHSDIPNTEQSEPSKPAGTKKNRVYQRHSQYSQKPQKFDADIADNAELQNVNVPPVIKTDEYNFKDAAEAAKTEFSKNTDYNFEDVPAETDGNIPFDKVQADKKKPDKPLKQNRQKLKTETPSAFSSDDTAPEQINRDKVKSDTSKQTDGTADKTEQAADVPFDRVKRFEQKAEKAQAKADKAQDKLPHKTKIKKKRLYDEQKQKPKNRLQFEKEVRPQSDLYHRSPIKQSAKTLQYAAMNKIHSKIAEVENDNTAVESAHKAEQKAETLARYSVRTAKYIDGQRKAAPYKKAARLKHKAEKMEVKAAYEKTLAEHPELKKSAVKKFAQKQRIKKQYQKAKRTEQTAKAAKKTAKLPFQTRCPY